jgi:hypothetical protein
MVHLEELEDMQDWGVAQRVKFRIAMTLVKIVDADLLMV